MSSAVAVDINRIANDVCRFRIMVVSQSLRLDRDSLTVEASFYLSNVMTNPYAPPPIVTREERKFRLEPTIRASRNSMKIGMLCGAVGGVLLEVGLLFSPRPPIEWLMAAPGLIFGLGIL